MKNILWEPIASSTPSPAPREAGSAAYVRLVVSLK